MGIFDSQTDVFTTYRAQLRFRDKIMGGTPKDPKIIMGWIKTRMGIDEIEELKRQTVLTLLDLGVENVTPDMTVEQLEQAAEKFAGSRQTNGFKIDPDIGLYIESRTVKAMVKECTNILFAGETWLKRPAGSVEGAYRGKGPKSAVSERVFPNPDKIALGRKEPDGVDLFIGHTNGPKGPQSNLTYYEYVSGAVVEFELMVARDFMVLDQWAELWCLAQENGLGALRSQGFGRFDIEAWDKVPTVARNGRGSLAVA